MKKLIILISSALLFLSCKQISKSIEDTFNANDSIVSKQPQKKTVPEPETTTSTTTETYTTTHSEQHIDGKSVNFLTDSSALIKAEKALKNLPQYAGKQIFVYLSIYFYDDGTINVMLQDPEKLKYIDQYKYADGVWAKQISMQLPLNNAIQSRMITPLHKISFASVAKVAQIYKEKATHIEGVSPISNIYITVWNNEIHWFPTNINGSQENYSIEFNADGSLKTFKKV